MESGRKKICVAMSGGVDSSVAAYLLSLQGYKLIGATMCMGIAHKDSQNACCGISAINDAKKVCDFLDIPHYVLDFSKYLRTDVIENFIYEYSCGRTPNPCVRCNRYLKFTALLNHALSCGYDAIATGHYARIGKWMGKSVLMRHRDPVKDQSYFLYSIPGDSLDRIVFPLSEYPKSEVRAIAHKARLPVAARPESQEICFIPDNDYRGFLRSNGISESPGLFVDTYGKILGTHRGVFNYTIGQRKGLGVACGSRLYVTSIDTTGNKIILGDRDKLLCRSLTAVQLNIFVDPLPFHCSAKVRYTQKETPCEAEIKDGVLNVRFNEPVEAVAPGQSVVLYLGDIVLGGGVIEKASG